VPARVATPPTSSCRPGYTVRGFGPLLENADAASRLYDLGFRLIVPAIDGPDYDLAPVKALLEWRDRINGV